MSPFSIPGTVYISIANRDHRDTEVRGKVGLGLHIFGLEEECEGEMSGDIKTKFNASHDCISYSKMGRHM